MLERDKNNAGKRTAFVYQAQLIAKEYEKILIPEEV
jgi:hypothetical protein